MNVRETIVNNISARMQQISTNVGYATNMGAHVFIWKTTPFQDNELEGIDIRDVSSEVLNNTSEMNYNYWDRSLNIEIEGRCKSGNATGQFCRSMIADINKAISLDLTWSGAAQHTVKAVGVNDELDVKEDGTIAGGVLIKIEIKYRTLEWVE